MPNAPRTGDRENDTVSFLIRTFGNALASPSAEKKLCETVGTGLTPVQPSVPLARSGSRAIPPVWNYTNPQRNLQIQFNEGKYKGEFCFRKSRKRLPQKNSRDSRFQKDIHPDGKTSILPYNSSR